jgi:hypothetical protein
VGKEREGCGCGEPHLKECFGGKGSPRSATEVVDEAHTPLFQRHGGTTGGDTDKRPAPPCNCGP